MCIVCAYVAIRIGRLLSPVFAALRCGMNRRGFHGKGRPWVSYRGGRGGGRGGHHSRDVEAQVSSSSSCPAPGRQDDTGDHYVRERPPPGLRGKEIGLWHARHQGLRNKVMELNEALEIRLDDHLSNRLNALAKDFAVLDNRPSSSCSFSEVLDEINAANERTTPQTPISCEIKRNAEVDASLVEDLQRVMDSKQYQKMKMFRDKLPAHTSKEDIIKGVNDNQVIVISGETGCGKTTQTGQFILDDMILKGQGSLCNILCTQPRRISAVSVAERVAEERCEGVGTKSVGYVIRLESKRPKRQQGTIMFCTTGVVFQYLKDDPFLKKYSHIILDEVHERDVQSDVLMAVLKDILPFRKDLKVILMSATINAEHFAEYFGKCPMLNIPGMTFPVTEYYLEDAIEELGYQFDPHDPDGYTQFPRGYEQYLEQFHRRDLLNKRKYSRSTTNQIFNPESEKFDSLLPLTAKLIEKIVKTDQSKGAILIFVTGWEEISKLDNHLTKSGRFPSNRFVILPVHSLMPTINQKQIFERPPPGVIKIIIATNIAETSITVDDVTHVIDFGKMKLTSFDRGKNLECLDATWISNANAKQRRGRAGRTQEGYCYHMYTRARQSTFEEFQKPEVLRKRLEEIILQLIVLKLGNIRRLLKRLLDPPDNKAVDLSFERLVLLQALDTDERLTPLGYHLSQLPMHPQTGKLVLLGAIFSVVDPIFTIAASLSYRDPFVMPLGKEHIVDRIRKEMAGDSKSDHWVIAQAIRGYERVAGNGRYGEREYCFRNFLSAPTCKLLVDFKKQFCEQLNEMDFLTSVDPKAEASNLNSSNMALVKAVVCAGLYPNVAKVKTRRLKKGPPFPVLMTQEDGTVYIHQKSVNADERNFECPFLVYHVKQKTKKIMLFDTTMISPYPLLFFGANLQHRVIERINIVEVDQTFRMKMSKGDFETVMALRGALAKLLALKIGHPCPTNWNPDSLEGKLVTTIRDLITQQYQEITSGNYE